jgi:hypothetical protein
LRHWEEEVADGAKRLADVIQRRRDLAATRFEHGHKDTLGLGSDFRSIMPGIKESIILLFGTFVQSKPPLDSLLPPPPSAEWIIKSTDDDIKYYKELLGQIAKEALRSKSLPELFDLCCIYLDFCKLI